MALPSTLFRFKVNLSDVTRGLYETLEFRVAMHPSEAPPFLLTRILAYCLNFQRGIEFTQGIANPDDPAVWVKDPTGLILLWIDIGNPSARRLHKAAKAAAEVQVFTYRDPEILLKEAEGQEIHKRDSIKIYAVSPKFLDKVTPHLARDNQWDLLRDEDELSLTIGETAFTSTLTSLRLK